MNNENTSVVEVFFVLEYNTHWQKVKKKKKNIRLFTASADYSHYKKITQLFGFYTYGTWKNQGLYIIFIKNNETHDFEW